MSMRATLRVALAVAVAAMAATAMAGAARPLPKFERVLTIEPRAVGDLAMTDQHGKPVRLSELAGAPALVFFGFTHCPEVCPTTLQKLAMIQRAQPKRLAGVRVVLISVDGERDTPEVLAEFLGRFSPDFVGLTAPAAEVRNLALKFSAPFFKDPPKDGAYLVQHSTRVYALDKQGRLRAEFYDVSPESVIGIGQALLAE
jgi:protein SCO1/2